MDILSLLLGIIIGILLAWFYLRSNYEQNVSKTAWEEAQKKYIQLTAERQFAEEKIHLLQHELTTLKETFHQKENALQHLQTQLATVATQEKLKSEKIAALTDEINAFKLELLKREQIMLELTSQLSSLKNQLTDYQQLKKQLQDANEKILHLSIALSEKEKEIQHLKDYQQHVEQLQEKFTQTFEHLSNQILSQHSEKFSAQQKHALTEMLSPLQERLKEFEKKVEETYDKESKQRFALEKEVKNLYELSQHISQEA
ncbi:MAG: DNA recombination protein RmuC, partial [Flammeovirgaceae bacterium]|nr:DNA recombination protein RmuC [Flammeovirgaceae bacterium]